MSAAPDYAIGWGTLALINAGDRAGKEQERSQLVSSIIIVCPYCNICSGCLLRYKEEVR